jgi:DNA-directed RNA polymerase specialized sigma24 family protein
VLRGACLRALREIRNCPEADPRVWVLTMVHQTAYEWLHTSRLDPLHSEFDGSASDRFPLEISYLAHQATCQNLCAEELVPRHSDYD